MPSKLQKHFLFNRTVLIAIGLLVIQQCIVASSTIWITRLIAHIQEGGISFFFLSLYLTSLFLPYFPGAAALIQMTKAQFRANVAFVKCFSDIYKGQVVEWANTSHHLTKSSILTSEASQTINGYLDYIYHFASCGLNVTLNLLVLVFVIEPLLLVPYGIGVILAFVILKLQKKRKKTLSLRAQQSRIKWVSILIKAWDNILLNNKYNFGIWEKKVSKRGRRLIGSNVKLEAFSQGISVGMAFILLGPTFIFIWYLATTRAQDLTWLAMMVVALPRLFQILSYSYELLFVLADFPMQKSRLETVLKILEPSELFNASNAHRVLDQRIHWDKIKIGYDNTASYFPKQLLESVPEKGRYTLQGENGSGKTSLLLLLKMLKGESAFYLPAKHELAFQLSKDGLSTGQFVRKTLEELLENLDTPLILLDEWDANLDKENMDKFSAIIENLSFNKCVIESRHLRT